MTKKYLALTPFVVEKITKERRTNEAYIHLIENIKTGCGAAVTLIIPLPQISNFDVG
jgi:hypothetical protein